MNPAPTGGRPHVVFLHGWLMGPDLWDAQVSALDGITKTHALAAPAHGTPGPPDNFTMAAWAAMVIGELDRRSVDRAIIVGHSMGGLLTQQIWRDHPNRVLGLGLVGTAARSATLDERDQFKELGRRCATHWREAAPTLAELLVGSGYLASNPRWVDQWTDRVEHDCDLSGMAPLTAAIDEHPDYTRTTVEISVPTVVVHGTDDRAIPIDLGRQLATIIPSADLVEIADCGHAVPMEQPEALTSAVRTLIDRVCCV